MTHFDRYKITQALDSGGMATVYLAEDRVLHRKVALKMVHPHLLRNKETAWRFTNEARAVAALAHENIIKVYDYGEEEDKRYLVMEYVDGFTLRDLLEAHPWLPNLVLLELAHQILAALAVAHANGIYHRDIKPGNIMIDRSGCVRVMDFGIAYLVRQESITMTGTLVGSPSYISPEQAEAKAISGKTDIFSLGTLLYRSATGKMPFEGDTPHAIIRGIMFDDPVCPDQLNPTLLHWSSDLIVRFLTKDTEQRPDAVEGMKQIEQLCAENGVRLGKQRLIRFLQDPQGCIEGERDELFHTYRHRAGELFRRKKVVSALKSLNQAKVFGVLSPEDHKWVAALGRQNFLRKAALVTGIVAVISTIGVGGFMAFRTMNSFLASTGNLSSRAETTIHPDSIPQLIEAPSEQLKPRPEASDSSLSVPAVQLNQSGPSPASPRREQSARTKPSGRANAEKPVSTANRRPPSPQQTAKDTTAPSSERVGYLLIRTNPPWATVIVDGIEVGNTGVLQPLAVQAGSHALLLRKEGFQDVRTALTIEPGDTLVRRIRLSELRPPNAAPTGKNATSPY
jgi:serine/threonine protein kinase